SPIPKPAPLASSLSKRPSPKSKSPSPTARTSTKPTILGVPPISLPRPLVSIGPSFSAPPASTNKPCSLSGNPQPSPAKLPSSPHSPSKLGKTSSPTTSSRTTPPRSPKPSPPSASPSLAP